MDSMESAKSSEMIITENSNVTFGRRGLSKERIITLTLLAVAVIVLVVGIALIAISSSGKKIDEKSPKATNTVALTTPKTPPNSCSYSEEAHRIGLAEFLGRVKATYYKLHPYDVHYDPDVTTDRVKKEYVAYDPTPSVIKNRTDTALSLLKEISNKEVNTDKLKPRERKAIAQVKHYLQHMFGQPYEVNYYAGDWMMGPNLYCRQQICNHGYGVYNSLGRHHKPRNAEDVKLIEKKLNSHKEGILQYIDNMKMGVRRGMIRSVEECEAGINAIKEKYLNVSLHNETGVLSEWYVQPFLDPDYYTGITKETDDEWKKTHDGKNVSETIKEYLVTYLGAPITKMIRYLETEHIRYCVPSNVSSGLASLPLKYVWLDGKENKSWPTNRTLPTGEPLNGSQAYFAIMSYFTTNKMTPLEVRRLGEEQLNILYPKVLAIAKEVTKESNNKTAIMNFKRILYNSSNSYFNVAPFPENESDKEAHRKCSDIESAKQFCPTRWAALQQWFSESRKVMSMLEPKTLPMFYFSGENATTPTCPIDMRPNLNPSSGHQSYQSSDADCTKSAIIKTPFWQKNFGPRFLEWSAIAHLARPGHHTQKQGNLEHFRDSCGGVIGWLDSVTSYTAFTEGWAMYAERPLIADDTDTYKNEPIQKYGMMNWQVWLAIRLIVDTGLHHFGLTRDDALKYFSKYGWDDTDFARREVTRYQSVPGQSVAYMIGQLDIMKAREYAKDKLGDKFSLREFHYQVLSQGSSPLAYLSDHVKKYVACVNDNTTEGCDVILTPPKKAEAKRRAAAVRWPMIKKDIEHYI